jgi:pimeloyl-[acyl-carrier protein] methyl ester esterase
MKDVVLLHGWGMSSVVFDALMRDLAPACRAHAVDLPGYGGRTRPEPYTLDALAQRVADGAPRRCAALGWSLGGLVALRWAAQAPEQVERLVIVAGTPCFVRRDDWPHAVAPEVLDSFASDLRLDRERTIRRFMALQAHGDENPKEVTRALAAASSDRFGVSDDALERGLGILRETDLRPHVDEISQPALLIHGARDELVPIAAAEYLAEHLRLAELEIVSGAAHAPFLSEPRRVAQRILDFLDE